MSSSSNAPVVLVTHARSYAASGGQWHFELRSTEGEVLLSAADREAETIGPRLELLAAVRGLEALEGPSDVTLLTASRYVRRGIVYGLDHWRQNGWTWEWFGHMVPVRNHDLWQRVDRALGYHHVQCPQVRLDAPHRKAAAPHSTRLGRREWHKRRRESAHAVAAVRDPLLDISWSDSPDDSALLAEGQRAAAQLAAEASWPRSEPAARRTAARRLRWQHWFSDQQESLRTRLAQLGTGLLPRPWLE